MIKKIKSKLWPAYTKAPINFSTITGLRYPQIPRLKGNFLLGKLSSLFQENGMLDTVIAAGKLAENHPTGMCYFWIGTKPVLLITKVDDAHELMVKRGHNLSRNLPLLDKFIGSCVFTDTEETCNQKRHTYHHATNTSALEKLEPGMLQVINTYTHQIDNSIDQPIQLRTLFYNLIADMVSSNLMECKGRSADGERDVNQLSELAEYLSVTMQDVFEFSNVFKWILPDFIRKIFFRNEENNFEHTKKRIKNRFYDIVLNPNKTQILASDNLLKKIWNINNSNKAEFSNEEIYGDGLFLLSAGVATTVATLEFIIKLLAAHPETVTTLQAEISKHINDGKITLQAVNQVAYLDMIIKEAMRLYPPVPFFLPREVATYTEINGVPLFKGDLPLVAPYILHRSPDVWDNPEAFIPERFAEGNGNSRTKDAYMPFSIGPRYCAGKKFAMLEMKLILAAFYSKYHIDVKNNSFETTLIQGGLSPKVPPVACFTAK